MVARCDSLTVNLRIFKAYDCYRGFGVIIVLHPTGNYLDYTIK